MIGAGVEVADLPVPAAHVGCEKTDICIGALNDLRCIEGLRQHKGHVALPTAQPHCNKRVLQYIKLAASVK